MHNLFLKILWNIFICTMRLHAMKLSLNEIDVCWILYTHRLQKILCSMFMYLCFWSWCIIWDEMWNSPLTTVFPVLKILQLEVFISRQFNQKLFINITYSWMTWFMGVSVGIRKLCVLWVVYVLIGIHLILMK